MNVNGTEYVEKKEVDSLLSELDCYKSVITAYRTVICKFLPLDDEQIDIKKELIDSLERSACYAPVAYRQIDLFVNKNSNLANTRVGYEIQIKELQRQITGLKSQIGHLKKQNATCADGGLIISKANIRKLKQAKEVFDFLASVYEEGGEEE